MSLSSSSLRAKIPESLATIEARRRRCARAPPSPPWSLVSVSPDPASSIPTLASMCAHTPMFANPGGNFSRSPAKRSSSPTRRARPSTLLSDASPGIASIANSGAISHLSNSRGRTATSNILPPRFPRARRSRASATPNTSSMKFPGSLSHARTDASPPPSRASRTTSAIVRSTENVRYPSGGSGAARASFDALVDVARARPQDVPRAHPATSRVRDAARARDGREDDARGSRARLAAATALASDMAPRYRDGRDRKADTAGGWRRHSPARETSTTVAVRRTRERTRTKSARAIVASHAAAPIARECAGRRR